jgi:hypothetical protein
MNPYADMSREELLLALEMFAKNWLAHHGCCGRQVLRQGVLSRL